MNCGVMRVEKRRRGDVYGIQIEANRTQEDHERGRDFDRSDINWTETNNNIHLVKTDHWNKEITRQIHTAGLKERSDSIVLVDGLYTASPEFFEGKTIEEIKDYFQACLDFHVQEYCRGDKSRVINAVIHLDEKTPHMQVASVPIYEDEKGFHLAAKNLLGGRGSFREHQNSFYENVTRGFGLDRGEVRDWGELKEHTTKREWQIATQEQLLAEAQEKTRSELERRQAAIDHANEQKLQALRERDEARTGRDVVKTMSLMKDIVLKPVSTDVDILEEKDAKKSLFGKETPATVTIPKEQLTELQARADVNAKTIVAAREMERLYIQMNSAAELANRNKIDAQTVAVNDRVKAAELTIEDLERDLVNTRSDLEAEKRKTGELTKQLEQVKAKSVDFMELQRLFPEQFERMKRLTRCKRMEYSLDHTQKDSWGQSYAVYEGKDTRIKWLLNEYVKECKSIGVSPRDDLCEWRKTLKERERDRGLSL